MFTGNLVDKCGFLKGTIYSAIQDPHSREVVEGAGPRKYLYAPDVVRGNDGRYYLYYCLSANQGKGGFGGPISIAVCDTPAGQYEYYGDVIYPNGKPVKDGVPFDPAIINDGGRIFLYYGWALPVPPTNNFLLKAIYKKLMKNMFHKTDEELREQGFEMMGSYVVELENDMKTVKYRPKSLIPCAFLAKDTEFAKHSFFEASSIRKIEDKYYFIYSTQVNHELAYATSDYPDRDFRFGGVIISNGDIGYQGRKAGNRVATTGNNHGSIVKVENQWYVFYHRHTHMSSNSRQGAAEKIAILQDGSIPQVEMTSCGLNDGPLKSSGTYPAVIACILTNGRMPHIGNSISKRDLPQITHKGKENYIGHIKNKTKIGYKYFFFTEAVNLELSLRGKFDGIIRISTAENETENVVETKLHLNSQTWEEVTTHINYVGKHAIYISFYGNGELELKTLTFR